MKYGRCLLFLYVLCVCLSSESVDSYSEELFKGGVLYSQNLHRSESRYEIWILSLLASCIVGLSGIVPLIFIPIDVSVELSKEQGSSRYLRRLLSFAVGGLLGDVFLHLLPEAWDYQKNFDSKYGPSHMMLGLWVLFGMFSFIVLEIIFTVSRTNNVITGYLNVMANGFDNFTHGLAVAASFLVGYKMGILTTFAILLHEIPHEIGDFAILLKCGLHPWTAAKAQISTAFIGILGVIVALSAESVDQVGVCASWILPFSAGGFLNIALVNVLPDILNEKNPWESINQLICIWTGIGVMTFVSVVL